MTMESKTDKIKHTAESIKRRIRSQPALLAAIKRMVEAEPTEDTGYLYEFHHDATDNGIAGEPIFACVYCEAQREVPDGPIDHAPDCVIAEGRAAIKLAEEGD